MRILIAALCVYAASTSVLAAENPRHKKEMQAIRAVVEENFRTSNNEDLAGCMATMTPYMPNRKEFASQLRSSSRIRTSTSGSWTYRLSLRKWQTTARLRSSGSPSRRSRKETRNFPTRSSARVVRCCPRGKSASSISSCTKSKASGWSTRSPGTCARPSCRKRRA